MGAHSRHCHAKSSGMAYFACVEYNKTNCVCPQNAHKYLRDFVFLCPRQWCRCECMLESEKLCVYVCVHKHVHIANSCTMVKCALAWEYVFESMCIRIAEKETLAPCAKSSLACLLYKACCSAYTFIRYMRACARWERSNRTLCESELGMCAVYLCRSACTYTSCRSACHTRVYVCMFWKKQQFSVQRACSAHMFKHMYLFGPVYYAFVRPEKEAYVLCGRILVWHAYSRLRVHVCIKFYCCV